MPHSGWKRIWTSTSPCLSADEGVFLLIFLSAALQAGYQVWTAEQECRQFRNQSAEHSNVIQQSHSAIAEQETQTEELFVVRRDQQQVRLRCYCRCLSCNTI